MRSHINILAYSYDLSKEKDAMEYNALQMRQEALQIKKHSIGELTFKELLIKISNTASITCNSESLTRDDMIQTDTVGPVFKWAEVRHLKTTTKVHGYILI